MKNFWKRLNLQQKKKQKKNKRTVEIYNSLRKTG